MGNYQLIAATGCPTGIAHTLYGTGSIGAGGEEKGRNDQS